MKAKHWILGILGIILLLGIIGGGYIYMNFFAASPLAVLSIDQGTVQYRTDSSDWKTASNGMSLNQGDSVKTLESSLAKIIFSESVMRLDSSTEVKIDTLNQEHVSVVQALGRTWSRLLKISGISNYEVSTPNAIASVRGTGFSVSYDGKKTEVKVAEGTVGVDSTENGNKIASLSVEKDKEAVVSSDDLNNIVESDLQVDDWITKNLGLDEQHKQELKAAIMKKYSLLLNTVKSQYSLTDAQLEDLFNQWYSGEISVKRGIADGTISSALASIIPEEFKRS